MHNLIDGIQALSGWDAILFLLLGALIGVVVGVIPGLSAPVVLAAILIFADHLSLTETLCLFMGALCGGFYAGSVSAILLNTPAHPEAFPITFDGYPMARKGEPGRALGLSAASTCVGGLIGCVVLACLLPVMDDLATVFHAPEYLALVTLALLLVGALHTDSIGKTFVASGAGLFLASIGPSAINGQYRYTFGHLQIVNGISLVAVVLGVFAVPQMMLVFGTGTAAAREDMLGNKIDPTLAEVSVGSDYRRQVFGGIAESFKRWPVLLQSGLVGAVTGIIPGVGAFTGNYMAYGIAKQLSRKKSEFGTGNPDGIIAPEGSSLAKEAGHIIPIVGLGIPGGVVGALFIGALSLKGLKVGEGFQDAYPGVTGQMVWIIAITGVVGTIMGLLMGSQIVKVTKLPGPLVVPFVFALCVTGPFFTETEFFPVIEMLVFAVVGVAFRRLGYPVGCFVIGLVLGPTFETNIYLTHNIYPGLSFFTARPLATVIFVIALLVVLAKVVESRRAAKLAKTAAAEASGDAVVEETAGVEEELSPSEARRRKRTQLPARHPVLAVITTPLLIALGVFVVIYAHQKYDVVTGAMPFIGGLAMAIPSVLSLPGDVRRFVGWLSVRRGTGGPKPDTQPGARTDALPDPEPVLVGAGGAPVTEGGGATAARPAPAPRAGLARLGLTRGGVAFDAAHPIRDESWGASGQYRRELYAFASLVGLVVLSWLIGFAVAVFAWVAVYGFFATRRYFESVWARAVFALVGAAVMYAITYEMFYLSFLTFTPRLSF